MSEAEEDQRALSDLQSGILDRQRSAVRYLKSHGHKAMKSFLDLIGPLSQGLSGTTIIYTGGAESVAADQLALLEVLQSAVLHILTTEANKITTSDLAECASLVDISYVRNLYYPPAGLAESHEAKLSFSDCRRLASEELESRNQES